ncbi:unnamed protein product [Orchesella dallaii]|uniref:Uncharacterized protein n=1 Tax=Orchesella dallaii TaxID=48710 RepID=A0ABP1PL13_9HEXA
MELLHLMLMMQIYSSFSTPSTIPIIFETSCFIRIVYETNSNVTLLSDSNISLPITAKTSSENTITYTIHDLQHFDFAFDVEDVYINDQLTIFHGYFKFFSKYHEICNAFILLTQTFNGTTTAIQNSGYGTDESATFFVVVKCCNNLLLSGNNTSDFITEITSFESESSNAFYPNLAFIVLPEFQQTDQIKVYAYCYYCPINLHELYHDYDSHTLSFLAVRSDCQRLNNNGWSRKIIVLEPAPPKEYENLVININERIGEGRKNFQKHLKESYIAEYFLFRMVSDLINMTIDPELKEHKADDDPETYWHLNIKVICTNLLTQRNEIAATRGSNVLTNQVKLELIYCMKISQLVKVKWDIYFKVLDPLTWLCLFLVILGYAFIYQSVWQAVDLVWILFDLEFWRRHPRKILVTYLIGAMFLPWAYDSGMSTDFIDFDFPIYIKDMIDDGYRLFKPGVTSETDVFDQIQNLIPKPFMNFFEANMGFIDIERFFYREKGFNFSGNSNVRVKAMADNKLFLQNGPENSFTFPSLFVVLSTTKNAVLEKDFVCGSVKQYPSYNLQMSQSFRFRGYMSTQFVNLLERLLEAGLVKFIQNLITLGSALGTMPRIDDLNSVLSSTTLGVRTPLGVICGAYVAFVSVVFLVFMSSVVISNRKIVGKTIERRYKEITTRISRDKVQVFKANY